MIITRLRNLFKKKPERFLSIANGELIPPGTYYMLNGRRAYSGKAYVIKVLCPFCSREHKHGGCEDLGQLVPTRLSHCGCGHEYVLRIRGGK